MFWRSWDGEHVVYNSGSGDTHVMDGLSAETLKRLECSPASSEELESWLAWQSAPHSMKEYSAYIAGLLEQLHSLAVIEPVDS
ncbi:MAG: HPr-rel-A system PqqD family peptide chaperone [Acidobacteriota bacterium]